MLPISKKYSPEQIINLAKAIDGNSFSYNWLKNNQSLELAAICCGFLNRDSSKSLEWLHKYNFRVLWSFIDSFDGNNVSAAICLSITGSGFWVSSLMNENFDLKPLETLKYKDITETPDDYFGDSSPFKDLYEKMQKINGVGPVTATKLLASNAPHLFPVRDRDVAGLFESSKKQEPFTYLEWCRKVREIMKDENVNDLLKNFLKDLKSRVEMQNPPSLLRVFDVIFWSKA